MPVVPAEVTAEYLNAAPRFSADPLCTNIYADILGNPEKPLDVSGPSSTAGTAAEYLQAMRRSPTSCCANIYADVIGKSKKPPDTSGPSSASLAPDSATDMAADARARATQPPTDRPSQGGAAVANAVEQQPPKPFADETRRQRQARAAQERARGAQERARVAEEEARRAHAEAVLAAARATRDRQDRQEAERSAARQMDLAAVRQRHFAKMVECDAYWQRKTNAPSSLPPGAPAEVQRLAEAAHKALGHHDLKAAVQCYVQAAVHPGAAAAGKEFADNGGVLMLLTGNNTRCVALCTEALAMDRTFLPAYLHRSRARRCLRDWDGARDDLQAAARLGTPESVAFGPDIAREAQLLALEQQHWASGQAPAPDFAKALELPRVCTAEVIGAAYKRLALQWHPDTWVGAGEAERKAAAARFQTVNEAHSVLSDPEQRAEWQLRAAVHTAPHLRLEVVDPPEPPPEPPADVGPRPAEAVLRQQTEANLQREQERRRQQEYARQDRYNTRIAGERERLLARKLEDDEAWQLTTNQPHRPPPDAPRDVRRWAEQGLQAFAAGDYRDALDHYRGALRCPGGPCKELLDNCAAALLLCGSHGRCLEVCDECLALDPGFVPAHLHKARALRGQGRLEAAQQALRAALAGGGAQTAAITREMQLLDIEAQDRRANPSPPDFPALLGVSGDVGPEALGAAFRREAKRWHPDRWVGAPEEQRRLASARFQAVSQAYETLADNDKRREWQQKVALRTPPHRRAFTFATTAAALEELSRKSSGLQNALRRQDSRRGAGAERPEREEVVRRMAWESEERERLDQERAEAARRSEAQEQQRVVLRMIELDAQWQAKTNAVPQALRLVPVPCLKPLVAAGNRALKSGDYAQAAGSYRKAMDFQPSGALWKEVADAHSICLLLSGRADLCVETCTAVLARDAEFLPAYLHRARALRQLRLHDHALQDLVKALALATASSRDISREAQIIVLEEHSYSETCGSYRQGLPAPQELQLPQVPERATLVDFLQDLGSLWQPLVNTEVFEAKNHAMIQSQAVADLLALLTNNGKRNALQKHFPRLPLPSAKSQVTDLDE